MRAISEGFEDLSLDRRWATQGSGCTIETGSPLRGRGCLRIDCTGVNYLINSALTVGDTFWKGFRFKFSSLAGAIGLIRWRQGPNDFCDLRINTSGKIELRVNGSLVSTGNKILSSNTEYHLQPFCMTGEYFWFQTKIDDSPIFDISYFTLTPANYSAWDTFHLGQFLAGGAGYMLIDDFVYNNGTSVVADSYTWPGMLTFLSTPPNANGSLNQWTVNPAATSAYADVDEQPNDGDMTSIVEAEGYKRQNLLFPSITIPAGPILRAVLVEAVAKVMSQPVGKKAMVMIGHESNGTHQSEIQKITFSAVPVSGQWTWQWNYRYASGDVMTLLYNDNAAAVQTKLEACLAVGVGGVAVTGDYTSGFTLTFQNQLANTPVNSVTCGSMLETAPITITVTRQQIGKGIWAGSNQELQISVDPNDYNTCDTDPSLTDSYKTISSRRGSDPDTGLAWNQTSADSYKAHFGSIIEK